MPRINRLYRINWTYTMADEDFQGKVDIIGRIVIQYHGQLSESDLICILPTNMIEENSSCFGAHKHTWNFECAK